MAVRDAHAAGTGARLSMRIGGQVSPLSGGPMDLDVAVRAPATDARQTGLVGTRLALEPRRAV